MPVCECAHARLGWLSSVQFRLLARETLRRMSGEDCDGVVCSSVVAGEYTCWTRRWMALPRAQTGECSGRRWEERTTAGVSGVCSVPAQGACSLGKELRAKTGFVEVVAAAVVVLVAVAAPPVEEEQDARLLTAVAEWEQVETGPAAESEMAGPAVDLSTIAWPLVLLHSHA